MTSEYEDIYSRFYLRVEDFKLAELGQRLAEEMMNGWMHSTLSKPYVRRLFSEMEIDDDNEQLNYDLKYQVSDEEDRDFVEELIVLGMVEAWLEPKYHTVLNTAQMFTNSEQKFYSQANHMTELREMYSQAKNDLRKLIRDRGYIYNSYLGES